MRGRLSDSRSEQYTCLVFKSPPSIFCHVLLSMLVDSGHVDRWRHASTDIYASYCIDHLLYQASFDRSSCYWLAKMAIRHRPLSILANSCRYPCSESLALWTSGEKSQGEKPQTLRIGYSSLIGKWCFPLLIVTIWCETGAHTPKNLLWWTLNGEKCWVAVYER